MIVHGSFDFLIFARSACELGRYRDRLSWRPLALPCHICLVAIMVGDDTYTTPLCLFGVAVSVKPRGTFDAGMIKQTLLALVTQESPRELSDPIKMPLVDLIRFADAEPGMRADGLPILGPCRSRKSIPQKGQPPTAAVLCFS